MAELAVQRFKNSSRGSSLPVHVTTHLDYIRKRLTISDIADSVVGRDYTLRNPHQSFPLPLQLWRLVNSGAFFPFSPITRSPALKNKAKSTREQLWRAIPIEHLGFAHLQPPKSLPDDTISLSTSVPPQSLSPSITKPFGRFNEPGRRRGPQERPGAPRHERTPDMKHFPRRPAS
jgi:hypothetical protein